MLAILPLIDPSITIPGCDTKGCSTYCTLDFTQNNNTVCRCERGYYLDADQKTCKGKIWKKNYRSNHKILKLSV